jgi:thymidylate synthase (FAD)
VANGEEDTVEIVKKLNVLDKGFVEVIDVMGSDARIVACARISYDNETKGEEADKKLIKYLLTHHHMSPFEQPHITFRMKAPIFVLRQLMRHRMANWNEVSARYTEVEDDYYVPLDWRKQSKVNHQGSDGVISGGWEAALCFEQMFRATDQAISSYKTLLKYGVSREMARIVLPVNMYSKVMFTIDLRNLLNLLAQRDHDGAQWETREFAKAMKALVVPYFPWTFEALSILNTTHEG